MHLKKIKLSGFKSFVDPVTIPFRSYRTAIVGPNGCGKSNVIDAVRWVMGESSAKQLRGEAMSDVIFNGTRLRKPVGQAAIELFFDNDSSRLGGEYAKYSELVIRREMNRDGFSNYYLNGVRCRRKDIVDVFLGTGLGPRSYSIIEQGMISQLIEAKPDDLRIHLEEAAGISKYKERRRETEKRISHTRDNLDRLNDIRQEIEKQLRHLKRQANAANRYKVLKQEHRRLKAELQSILWKEVNEEVLLQNDKVKEKELELEAKLSEQSHIVAEIERERSDHTEASDAYNEVQGRYYSLGSMIGRIEQQIEHNKERCSQLSQDLLQLDSVCDEVQKNIRSDKNRYELLQKELIALNPKARELCELTEKATIGLQVAEDTMGEWQIAWDSFAHQAAHSSQQAKVEQARIDHLQQRREQEKQIIARLEQEQQDMDQSAVLKDIASITVEYEQSKIMRNRLQSLLQDKQKHISVHREKNSRLTAALDDARHKLQKLHGRFASLEALQQAALGKNDQHINSWLRSNRLFDNPRLAEGLTVEPGWEKAVETVLFSHLEAVCVTNLDDIAHSLANLEQGSVTFYDVAPKFVAGTVRTETLLSRVNAKWSLSNLLSHIYIADDLTQALRLRKSLGKGESVVTRDGVWLGRSWLFVNKEQDAKQGVLQRETELKELNINIQNAAQCVLKHEQLLQQSQCELREIEQDHDKLQCELTDIAGKYGDVYGKLTAKRTKLEHMEQRAVTVTQQLYEQRQCLLATEQQLQAVHDIWRKAEKSKLTDKEKRTAMQKQREQYLANLETARDKAQEHKRSADEITMRIEFARNQLQYLEQSLERAQQQVTNLTSRRERLVTAIKSTKSPLDMLHSELEQALTKRLNAENELLIAKQRLEHIEHELQSAEKRRNIVEEQAQAIRDCISRLKIDVKALQVRADTYEEQILERGFVLEQILDALSQDHSVADLEEKLSDMAKRIDRLGPINLAAINEYEQNSERKQYLNAQNDDLVAALSTLEDAVQRIDRETRARFKDTFNTVNSEFMRLFPIVFGGGHAYLELIGDDLLSTGVMIHAQPPGKRNSTIHLLSGGEKALTAIALVFAIFQLNPAPFCMLDEVDAPLDDNNVVRFINLVNNMSKSVQFIFITHNKITMEMADQLTGVTMQEPGVSRIVAVDIQEAIDLAKK